jgi:chemotaxis response regulator CheB
VEPTPFDASVTPQRDALPWFIAIVLTGMGADGTDGVQSVRAHGGPVIAQDQLEVS